jgi:hypothetical protein
MDRVDVVSYNGSEWAHKDKYVYLIKQDSQYPSDSMTAVCSNKNKEGMRDAIISMYQWNSIVKVGREGQVDLYIVRTNHFVCRFDQELPQCVLGGCLDSECNTCKNSTSLVSN